jgi:hypothetical protein
VSRSVVLADGPKAGQAVQVADDASELVVPIPTPEAPFADFPPNGSSIKPTDPDVLARVYYKPSGRVLGGNELWTCQGEQP